MYVDKHKAAAITQGGQQDLLSDLKAQEHMNRKFLVQRVAFGMGWNLYVKEGIRNLSRGNLLPALKNFTQAIGKKLSRSSMSCSCCCQG